MRVRAYFSDTENSEEDGGGDFVVTCRIHEMLSLGTSTPALDEIWDEGRDVEFSRIRVRLFLRDAYFVVFSPRESERFLIFSEVDGTGDMVLQDYDPELNLAEVHTAIRQ